MAIGTHVFICSPLIDRLKINTLKDEFHAFLYEEAVLEIRCGLFQCKGQLRQRAVGGWQLSVEHGTPGDQALPVRPRLDKAQRFAGSRRRGADPPDLEMSGP